MPNEASFLRGRVPELLIAVVFVTLIGGGYRDCLAEGANSPKLFAPGVISGPADEQSPAFAPDGKSVYFTRRNASTATILKSTFANEHWLKPTVASFSGQWRDLEPAMAPDGTYLIFASNRPSIEGKSALDGDYNGKIRPAVGGNLWRVDHEGDGWGRPEHLSDAVNQGTAVFSPSIAADGSLYFMRWVEKTGGFHLFRSQYESGRYMAAEPVGVGDSKTDEVDPAVAPDESFLVYSSSHPAKHDQTRLLIAFRIAGGWSTPQDLGDEVNEAGDNIEARLSPDRRTLYFSTNTVPPVSFPRTRQQSANDLDEMMLWANGRQNIWYVSLAPWLDAKKPASQIAPVSLTPVTLGGIINQDSDDTLAFTPDHNTVFFDRSDGPRKTIMVSHPMNGHWSPPQPASFSGQWFDQDPLVAPDGSFLLFNSDRPLSSGGKPLVQNYFSGGPGPGSNLWRVDRKGDNWGDPVWLGPTINSDVFIDFASLASDGTLYFMRWDAAQKSMHLWRSQYKHGSYLAPEFVTLGDPAESIHDPAVAADQSFIVFDSGKVKGGLGRLCIAFREGEGWGKPIDLGDSLNKDLPWGSHLDPDGRTIYFTGNSGIQSFSLVPWLDAHRQ